VGRLAEALDRRAGRGLNGARVLLVGLAYKRNVDDVRESPAFAIWELLEARGALISYHDPHVPEVPRTREHGPLAGRRSVPLTPEVTAGLDAAVVVTDHDAVDYRGLAAAVGLVVDTRNVMGRFQAGTGCEVVPA
jgi:UDP-N-acetyl-D-glucosamine dehydrogenase